MPMIEIGFEASRFVVQKIAPKLLEKFKKRAMEKKSVPKGIIVVNVSGHPLSETAEKMFSDIYNTDSILNISVPNADIDNLVPNAEDIVNQMIDYMGKKILTGEYVVIPPGFSPLTLVLFAMLHGITGHFPRFHPLKKGDFGFVPASSSYDLQTIRNNNRRR